MIAGKKGKDIIMSYEVDNVVESIKLVQEMKCLILGMSDGVVKVYKWHFDFSNEKSNIRDYLIFLTNLHSGPVMNISILNSSKYLITCSTDGSIYLNEFYVRYGTEYMFYNKLMDINPLKSKFEPVTEISDLFAFKINEVRSIDHKVDNLIKNKTFLEKSNKDTIENKASDYDKDIKTLEDNVNNK